MKSNRPPGCGVMHSTCALEGRGGLDACPLITPRSKTALGLEDFLPDAFHRHVSNASTVQVNHCTKSMAGQLRPLYASAYLLPLHDAANSSEKK